MDVVILQVFVSLALVIGSLLLFAFSIKQKDHEDAHRLALFPLEDDDGAAEPPIDSDTKKDSQSAPHWETP